MRKNPLPFARHSFFLYLLLGFLSIAPLSLSAQVYNGNLTLNNQAAVDAFSYTEVTGILTISGYQINNLNSLSSLISVGQEMIISGNDALTNLDGLSALTVVRGGLKISGNPALTNLGGLSSLTSVGELGAASQSGGTLEISYNDALTNLDGLSGLNSSSLVAIISNPMLMNLDGLSGLTSRVGFAAVYITNNAALAGFCGLYPLLNSSGAASSIYYVVGNLDNPTIADILAGGPCNLNPAQLITDLLADGTLNQGQANALNAKLNNCRLNAFNNLTNAWVNAGLLTQPQADLLNAAALQHCTPPARIAAPQAVSLGQNYPNPARTHTVIPFTLTTSGNVNIKLYDTAGKMVNNVMDEYLTEGTHKVKVNLQALPAGTYFYKIQIGEQIETSLMMVE